MDTSSNNAARFVPLRTKPTAAANIFPTHRSNRRNYFTAALTNSFGELQRDPGGGRIGVRSGRTGKMTSGWRRNLGNVRTFVSNSMGDLRGRTNFASWIVAGTLAYFLWVKPAQDLKREHEERTALAAADPYRHVEKRKPMPGPQETGLIYGERSKIDHGQKRVEKPEE